MDLKVKLLKSSPSNGIETFALVPDLQQFVRDTSNYGTTGAAVNRIMGMSLLNKIKLAKVAMMHPAAALGFRFELLMNLVLMAEASHFHKPKVIVLHHQITDLALSFELPGLFRIFQEIVSGEFGAEAGLSTMNFVRLSEVLDRNQIKFPWIMAPFNPKGYQMHPSAEACHTLLKNSPAKIIASNPCLFGTLPTPETEAYLKAHSFAAATLAPL